MVWETGEKWVQGPGEQTWIWSIMLLVWQPHAAMSEDDWGSRTSLSIKWYGWMGRFGPKMAGLSTFQKGAKGTKMVNLSVFDPLGPFWIHLDPFGPFQTKIDFLLWRTSAETYFRRNFFVWNDPKESQMVKNTKTDHFGPFKTLLDHFGTLTNLPCLPVFGPKGPFLGHPHSWTLDPKAHIAKIGNAVQVTIWL